MKLKNCRKCQQDLPLTSFTSTQAKYCNNCRIIVKLEQQKERQQRAFERLHNKKQKKEVIVSLSELKKQTQSVFNKWIRMRDKDDPCISCQGYCGKWDAGHFWAQGSKGALRFNEDNCHKQGVGCNRYKHANLLEYRINLVKKIGEERVQWLDEHRNDQKKWTREELEGIKSHYQQLIDSMEK